jgi:hypothetical protein
MMLTIIGGLSVVLIAATTAYRALARTEEVWEKRAAARGLPIASGQAPPEAELQKIRVAGWVSVAFAAVTAVVVLVAMSIDHQAFLFDAFRYRSPLFNEVCYGRSEPLLDVWEAVPTWETDLEAARHHAFQVMEHIWASMPCLLQHLGRYLTIERVE